MGDHNSVHIPDSILEQLRCTMCTGYLSCAPIQVLPDGKSICGHCGPSASDGSSYRDLSLEAIISKVAFPCKYKNYGCEQRLLFGEAQEHEGTCSYRGFTCPAPLCLWKGPMLQLQEHFTKNHFDLVKDITEFDLDIEKDKRELVMVIVEQVSFMVKYKYNATARDLYYDIRYFESVKEASCKIRLLNGLDSDYSVTAKGSMCQPYDCSFNNTQLSNVVGMSSLLPALNHPNNVVVAIDLTFIKSDELLKCAACKEYLTLPIFDYDGDIVCSDCYFLFTDVKPSTNTDLRHITYSGIQCCWYNCRVMEKGDNIIKHQKECEHRIYPCIVPNCSDTFDNSKKNSHMQAHGYEQFYANCYYTMNFSNFSNNKNYFYAMINKEMIIIKTETYLTYNFNTAREYTVHRITLKATDDAYNTATVVFTHAHCNKLKKFIINKQLEVSVENLPRCFKEDYLSVMINLCN